MNIVRVSSLPSIEPLNGFTVSLELKYCMYKIIPVPLAMVRLRGTLTRMCDCFVLLMGNAYGFRSATPRLGWYMNQETDPAHGAGSGTGACRAGAARRIRTGRPVGWSVIAGLVSQRPPASRCPIRGCADMQKGCCFPIDAGLRMSRRASSSKPYPVLEPKQENERKVKSKEYWHTLAYHESSN